MVVANYVQDKLKIEITAFLDNLISTILPMVEIFHYLSERVGGRKPGH
ncbi:MAG: hypothetical protein WBA41_06700 [Rivularia sp. (in: cyanobacteria)]